MNVNNIRMNPFDHLLKRPSIDKIIDSVNPWIFSVAKRHQPCLNPRDIQSRHKTLTGSRRASTLTRESRYNMKHFHPQSRHIYISANT